jgi:hypothetical protein
MFFDAINDFFTVPFSIIFTLYTSPVWLPLDE